jgi:quercetin dioxygenase-like cupin family protein
MSFQERAIVLRPGEGGAVSVLGNRYTYKATGEQTGGAYGLVENSVPAGSAGPPPHVHVGEEEAFYVLDGEVTVLLGDREIAASAGSFALVPRGTVHTYANRTDREARLLVIISPAGFERAFAEMAEVAPSAEEPPDMDRLMEIARRYNLEFVGP